MLQKLSEINQQNIFLEELKKSLPRILSLFDSDQTSLSYGLGDRFFWAWGLTDFANATYQGCAQGLARIWVAGLWPYDSCEESFIKKIQSFFAGAKFLTRKNGSLEEAFPHEGSYCVTALVAFDLLVTIDLLSDRINDSKRDEFVEIIRPFINFLIKSDESHAIISNHLATAVAALVRWDNLISDSNALAKAKALLNRMLVNQSEEGWFKEYEGSDPGYQTLCLHYLSDVHLQRKEMNLLEPISKSIRFLLYFAHPDGSLGGYYGSRCTRFYYPSGVLAMAEEVPEAAVLATFMQNSTAENRVVGLSCMDDPNLTPMFNSYAWAATLLKQNKQISIQNNAQLLPCESYQPFRKNFKDAGLFVDRGLDYYSIINYKKGGVIYHFSKKDLSILNCGVVIQSSLGILGSGHFYDENQDVKIEDECIQIRHRISEMPKKLMSPFKFLMLRILCFTIFRNSYMREFTKKILVRYLITKPKIWRIWNEREIRLGRNLEITDNFDSKAGYRKSKINQPFVPIHMASQGYWQLKDEES